MLHQHEVNYILRTFSGESIRKQGICGSKTSGVYAIENALARPDDKQPYGQEFDVLVIGHTLRPRDSIDYLCTPHEDSDKTSIQMWRFDSR